MKKLFYGLLSKLIKFYSKNTIVGKKFNGSEKTLYYEKAQHLTFLFQSELKYEVNIQNNIKEFINEGAIVFDIGANIGQYAIPFSEFVGESGRVYSFEPDYKNYSFLQFNLNINKCINVSCLNYGIGKEDSEMLFYRDTETGGRSGSFKEKYVGSGYNGFNEKVVLKSFDSVIATFGEPNFVKIDVEGFEEDVVEGLTLDLNNCVFLVEVREDTKNRVFDYFDKKGYQCFWIENGNQPISQAEEIPGFSNLIFRKISS